MAFLWLVVASTLTLTALPAVAADPDGDTIPPTLIGNREEAPCRFSASDGFDEGPPPRAYDLKVMAQDATLYFGEIASELTARSPKPPSGEAVAQAIENDLNSFAHHRRNYWRRRRSRLFDHRRTVADAAGKIFRHCSGIPTKTAEVAAACERLVKDRASLEKPLGPESSAPAKLEALETEVHDAAVATKEAADLIDNAAGLPFFELEKALNKEFGKFDIVGRGRGAVDGRKEEVQEKLTRAEAELYRLEDEVNRNTEAQEDALETTIEDLRKQLEKLNAGDDVKLEMALLPPSWKDSVELRNIKADKKVKPWIAKNASPYRVERTKYRAVAEALDHEAGRVERVAKFDPTTAFTAPRLATTLLERGDELPVAIHYVIEANPAAGRKPEVVSTTLWCGTRKKQEGLAFLASWTPPRPAPPPTKPAPPEKGKRSIAAMKAPKAPAWPSPTLHTRAVERLGLEEAIECNTWTLYCNRAPEPARTPEKPDEE